MSGESDTIDWELFWDRADEADRQGASPAAHHVPSVLEDFITARGVPDRVADVGCGTGVAARHVAETYPGTEVVGFDVAESVLAENRRRAREAGLENLRFERAALPAFDPDGSFDLVLCYGTLYYVRETDAALRALYEAVAPGGDLLFNYPNDMARAHYRTTVEGAGGTGIADTPGFEPERYAERFRLVLEGETTLSYDRIESVLGTWPQSVFRVAAEPEGRWARRHHPFVFVPR